MGFVPTGVCRHCKRMLTRSEDGTEWQDSYGWFICSMSNDRQHRPVDDMSVSKR